MNESIAEWFAARQKRDEEAVAYHIDEVRSSARAASAA